MAESNTMQLKYLFMVEFTDGTFFHQQADDKSNIFPGKSQYTDLLAVGKPMRRAWLNAVGFTNTLMVDLHDGHFEVDGFWLQIDQNPLPPIQRELIFFREHQHDANATYLIQTGEVQNIKEIAHRVKYFIGWKVTINNVVHVVVFLISSH